MSEFITNLDLREKTGSNKIIHDLTPRLNDTRPDDYLSRFTIIFNVHLQCHKEQIPLTEVA